MSNVLALALPQSHLKVDSHVTTFQLLLSC